MSEEILIYQYQGLYGAINKDGEIIINAQYREMHPFSCGLAMVRNEHLDYAYVNKNNEQIISFGKYDWCDSQFVCGYARVIKYERDNKKWGIIDVKGNVVIPIEYDNIWTLKENFLNDIKASKGDKELRINLFNKTLTTFALLEGLTYINTYTVEEFKSISNCSHLYVKTFSNKRKLYFTYGSNIGFVGGDKIPVEPIIAIVINAAGRIFPLLLEKNDIGKSTFDTNELSIKPKSVKRKNVKQYSSWEYHNEVMNDPDYWSDPYGLESDFYDGWSKEDVESGLADAYEGDLSARWNTD